MIPATLSVLVQLLSMPVPLTPPVDTLVDVEGYRMHLVLYRGVKPLTLVMESGGGASLDDAWLALEAQLAARTGATVVAYDRAGFGKSGTGPGELTPRQQVQQLNQVLQKLKAPPKRILVGASYGGLMVVLHGHLYPDSVRGLVLIDPMNPRFVQATGDFVQSTVPHIEHPMSPRDTALVRMVRTFDGLVRDPDASDDGLAVPMVIVSAGEEWWGRKEIDRAWRASHESMVKAGPNRRLVVADGSNHDIAGKRPDTVVDALLSLAKGR
ncbi:MAG TPA: alpha/beta hydrolase family protein [Gemmatimonadales bacterium]